MDLGHAHLLVGRDEELGALNAAYACACAGRPTVVVIEGEPGIGKTRLVRELATKIRADGAPGATPDAGGTIGDPIIATGHGVDLAGGAIPFGLISNLLEDLVTEVGAARATSLLGHQAATLAPLVPSIGVGTAVELDRLQVYSTVQHLLAVLARDVPLILFAEDVHWADQHSRDMLSFIGRCLTKGSLLLVLTTRTVNDVDSAAIIQLGHLTHGEHIILQPLPAAAIERQINSIDLGLSQDERARVLALSEGIPLYVEELVAGSQARSAADRLGVVPAGLRVDLASRVKELRRDQAEAMEAAAVHEQPFTTAQLALVTDSNELAVASALDAGVQAGLLDGLPHGQYRYHHALVRSAVAQSLTPSAGSRWHRRWASALETGGAATRPETIVAIADHLFLSGASQEAITACQRAGRTSQRLGAPTEAAVHWRRILRLLDVRTDLGTDELRDEVLATLRLDLGTDWVSVRDLILEELAHDPAVAGIRGLFLWLLQAASASQLQIATPVPSLSRLQDARATLDSAPASLMVVVTAENLVRVVMAFHPDEHELQQRALELLDRTSAAVGNQRMISMVNEWNGWIDATEGRIDEAMKRMELLAAQPDNDASSRLYYQAIVVAFLLEQGHLREALRRGWAALEIVPHPAADASWSYLAFQLAWAHYLVGDWDRASELHAQLATLRSWHSTHLYMKEARALLAFGRGDLAGAREQLDQMEQQLPDPETSNLDIARWAAIPTVSALLAAADGDGDRAAAQLKRLLTAERLGPATPDAWQGLILAAQLAWELPPTDPGWVSLVRDARDRMYRTGPVGEAWFLDVEANLARTEGLDTPEAWRDAVDAWIRVGAVHFEAVCRLRLAETLLREPAQRQAAADELSAALRIAIHAGAAPLGDQVHGLAGRARLSLSDAGTADGASVVNVDGARARQRRTAGHGDRDRGAGPLTERELDVLALLAEGRTNAQIGSALYISPKTVSVHVSRIIDKLGAANRTQVVALAHRAGLLQGSSAQNAVD